MRCMSSSEASWTSSIVMTSPPAFSADRFINALRFGCLTWMVVPPETTPMDPVMETASTAVAGLNS